MTRQNPSQDDSSKGLGRYHGSIHVPGNTSVTIYYAVGVYSEILSGGVNDIVVFDTTWKNIVATFYHELNEARTDPDVEDTRDSDESPLGWHSEGPNIPPGPNGNHVGGECGDIHIDEVHIFAENPDIIFVISIFIKGK